jgi:WS/DGAT/MGAT family acyltransferase
MGSMTEQLSGLDASFLYLETGNMPMHIGSLAIYDQSTAPGGAVTFKQILDFFDKRLHKARAFRQRLVTVPMSLDHPYWIEDPDFDLEFHVRHIALPSPGDWRQLCIQTARLHARPLDTSRPLWEAYVIEGLDNVEGVPQGSFALSLNFITLPSTVHPAPKFLQRFMGLHRQVLSTHPIVHGNPSESRAPWNYSRGQP